MPELDWDRFEWDDENKKNGNVQHLRDHSIEPSEAEECFFHDYKITPDDRRLMTCILSMEEPIAAESWRLVFQDKGNGLARVFTGWELRPKKRKR